MSPIQVSALVRPTLAAALLHISLSSAIAQGHSDTRGPYTLRASTVSSMNIPADHAKTAGIERGADKAVLNVVVQRAQPPADTQTVKAKVEARVTSPIGRVQTVSMKENTDNNHVSYIGVYTVVPNEEVDIAVKATPAGAAEPLQLNFKERTSGARTD